ncbi:uncharacterized protein V1516DRAFT_701523 [Lipomyces oligophaga]|uniref:uncharacterized protein n=1 Tax=Lipomyces oligophaga TaxID=45792 RepID=UPI0034CF80F2
MEGEDKLQSEGQDKTPENALTKNCVGLIEERKRSISELLEGPTKYPRRRAIIACEVCRARKSKCDGGHPKCRLCIDLNAECVYRERGFKLEARDKLILDRLDSLEALFRSSSERLEKNLSSVLQLQSNQISEEPQSPLLPSASVSLSSVSTPLLPVTAQTSPSYSRQLAPSPIPSSNSAHSKSDRSSKSEYSFSIPEDHSTTWLHLIQRPQVSQLLSAPTKLLHSPLHLEIERLPLNFDSNVLLDLSQVQPLVISYFQNVNPFIALISPYSWESYYRTAMANGFQSGSESLVVLSALALGEAAQQVSITLIPSGAPIPGKELFSRAWLLVGRSLLSSSLIDLQALLLCSVYFFFLIRPLDSWNLISIVCSKVRAICSADLDLSADNRELLKRIYWNALIFESYILAELDLPHSGIECIEEQIGLPSGFLEPPVMPLTVPGTDEIWYFLADIALRKLLNRVHAMLYSKASRKMPISSFHPIVEELEFQLNQWYENLPSPIKFQFGKDKPTNRFSTMLRLRYYVCQSIIWRVYVEAALENNSLLKDERISRGALKCIEASLFRVENIDQQRDGHILYIWQGSLALVAQIILLMAISVSPVLSQLLPYPTAKITHIIRYSVKTMVLHGTFAPSIKIAANALLDAEQKWSERIGILLRT